jgi:hypothetical protein
MENKQRPETELEIDLWREEREIRRTKEEFGEWEGWQM